MLTQSKVIAFDVDHTLAIQGGPYPPGPVQFEELLKLRAEGHIVGICGNWAVFVNCVPNWTQYQTSFLGPTSGHKAPFLRSLKLYLPASDFIIVGNNPRDKKWWGTGVSDDWLAAKDAGWKFISEDDYAAGERNGS